MPRKSNTAGPQASSAPGTTPPDDSGPSSAEALLPPGSGPEPLSGSWEWDGSIDLRIDWQLWAPPSGYRARVTLFQGGNVLVEARLSDREPAVPFSVQGAVQSSPYLQGNLVLAQDPLLAVEQFSFPGHPSRTLILYTAFPLDPEEAATAGGAPKKRPRMTLKKQRQPRRGRTRE
jgi:hypothetical protein